MSDLLARAAALAQREGYTPPPNSDVGKYIASQNQTQRPGTTPSRTPAPTPSTTDHRAPLNAGYTADQSLSKALGLMGRVTRGFSGGTDPVSQLRALPGERESFMDAIGRETRDTLSRIDEVMSAVNIPSISRAVGNVDNAFRNLPREPGAPEAINRTPLIRPNENMNMNMIPLTKPNENMNMTPLTKPKVDFSRLIKGKPELSVASDLPLSGSAPAPLVDSRKDNMSAGSYVYNQPYGGYLNDATFNMSQGPGGSYSHDGKSAWDIYPMKKTGDGGYFTQEQRQDIPVVAVTNGEVVYSGPSSGYGNLVVVRGLDGTLYKYGHNTSNAVNIGDRVAEGQILGNFGMTGGPRNTGVHVHFEVVKDANWNNDWYEGGRSLEKREQSDVWERLAYWYGL